jgi:type IX secretion system PorP/SprF family membrane protein
MKKFIPRILFATLLLIAGFVREANAQQDPSYSLYMFDKLLVNPSFCGSSNYVVGALKYRQQFTGIEGKPVTETFTLQVPLQKKYMGIGLKVIQDQLGVTKQTTATFLYAYHLGFGNGKP